MGESVLVLDVEVTLTFFRISTHLSFTLEFLKRIFADENIISGNDYSLIIKDLGTSADEVQLREFIIGRTN